MGISLFLKSASSVSVDIPLNRKTLLGGGVALFVKSDISFCIRNDLKIDLIESIWIKTQDMIIGVIYKPPNFSNTEFLDKLEVTLHSIFLSKKKF